MRTKLRLALREVKERMDAPTPMFGEDWLETFHFLQSQILDHTNAIGTKVEVSWNTIMKDQDFWMTVWRFKEGTADYIFHCSCGVNPEPMMDVDAIKGQRMHVKEFLDEIIKNI